MSLYEPYSVAMLEFWLDRGKGRGARMGICSCFYEPTDELEAEPAHGRRPGYKVPFRFTGKLAKLTV